MTFVRVVGIGRIKKPDRVIRVCFYGVPLPKVFDLGRLSVFRFVELAKEGFVERLANIQAGSDELVEDGRDTGDDLAGLGFSEYREASQDSNALAKRFSSRFTLINKESCALFFG